MKGTFNRLLIALTFTTVIFDQAEALAANRATGKATVESDSFAGKKTASGQKYNPHALMGASRSLPLGSKVRVTNRRTGKSATVTINDKTAKGAGNLVDLSKGAANKIGVKGTAPVEASVVGAASK